jgi:hypothetical protein
MDKKQKTQIIILAVLVIAFLVGLSYRFSGKGAPGLEFIKIGEPAAPKFTEDEALDAIPRPDGALDVKYEKIGKDPLKNMLLEYMYEKEAEPLTPADVPLPPLDIQGLIWNSQMPQAIINGRVVKEGDIIEGVKIVTIDKTGVTVEHLDRKVFISK